jgi:hypothetical protein
MIKESMIKPVSAILGDVFEDETVVPFVVGGCGVTR